MTKEQCDDILVMLKACYPNFKLELNSKESKYWIACLIDLEFEKAFIAAQQLTKTSKWAPSIAEIRAAYTELLLPDLVDAEQAWGMVVQAINKHGGIYSTDAAMNELPRQVQEAVKWIGGIRAISQAEKPDVLRGQFTRAMDAVNKRLTKELSLGPKLGNQIDNIRLGLKEQEEMLKLENTNSVKQITYGPVTDDSKIDYNIKQCGILREAYAKAQQNLNKGELS
ncbi:replicative helicase loader/inhibitor [Niameybacter massiliensis]|uniref:replicative helicase loader/inhibitor n=1 Tax=Niameybacter massiliensis TaxID=1658108 RepID=UPI0006B5EB96|nr:replicative helicase loader/inhibitor [Niameybacter massiliensis]